MDPYLTLGVSKDCTREELKEAFRAKARLAHPDAGGDPDAFIRLRQAYDHIMTGLKRKPRGPIVDTHPRSSRPDHRTKQPDPNWKPDLIVLDEPLPRVRPPRPLDPNWKPDLVLLDEEPRNGRFSQSRDSRAQRENLVGWLGRLSDRSRPAPRDAAWNLSGLMALVVVVIITVWICWAAWSSGRPVEGLESAPMVLPAFE